MIINTLRTFKKLSFSFLSITLIVLLFASTSSALTSGSFSASPGSGGKTWFVYDLKPGQSISDSIVITNSQNVSQTFYVYASDLVNGTDGGFAIKQRKEPMMDIGTWIKLTKNEVTLAPKSSQTIPFKLTVPNDSKLDAGEHAGGIAVEGKEGEKSVGQQGIIMHKRIGVRVYVTLPGEIIKDIKYTSFTKKISKFRSFIIPSNYQFSVMLDNIGNVSNTVELTLNSKNLITGKIGTKKYNQLLTRETKGVSNFDWKAPFFGVYSFTVDGKYQTKDGTGKFTTETFTGIIIPWDFILLVVLLCVFARKGFKKYKKIYSGEGWAKYKVTNRDTLESLAKTHSVTWKQIAKVNKLKAPYSLKEDQAILLPKKHEPTSRK
jgi:hypothetical protein